MNLIPVTNKDKRHTSIQQCMVTGGIIKIGTGTVQYDVTLTSAVIKEERYIKILQDSRGK
jgi:hypothetical protein